jgi:hypothetical protein
MLPSRTTTAPDPTSSKERAPGRDEEEVRWNERLGKVAGHEPLQPRFP